MQTNIVIERMTRLTIYRKSLLVNVLFMEALRDVNFSSFGFFLSLEKFGEFPLQHKQLHSYFLWMMTELPVH